MIAHVVRNGHIKMYAFECQLFDFYWLNYVDIISNPPQKSIITIW